MHLKNYVPVLILTIGFVTLCGISVYSEPEFNNSDSVITDYKDSISSSEDSLIAYIEQLKQGKKLYEKKCQRCHELHSPKDYRLNKWKENLDEMKDKAELTSTEYKLILNYLAANCRK